MTVSVAKTHLYPARLRRQGPYLQCCSTAQLAVNPLEVTELSLDLAPGRPCAFMVLTANDLRDSIKQLHFIYCIYICTTFIQHFKAFSVQFICPLWTWYAVLLHIWSCSLTNVAITCYVITLLTSFLQRKTLGPWENIFYIYSHFLLSTHCEIRRRRLEGPLQPAYLARVMSLSAVIDHENG